MTAQERRELLGIALFATIGGLCILLQELFV